MTTPIRRIVADIAGPEAMVRLFGSRLHDAEVGGDLDLLVELPEAVDHPAAHPCRCWTGCGSR